MYVAEPVIRDTNPDPTEPEVYRPIAEARTAEARRVGRRGRKLRLPSTFTPPTEGPQPTVAYVDRGYHSLYVEALCNGDAWRRR